MAWYHRLINVVRGDRLSRDIAREMRFHVEQRAEELIARGMTPEDAEREARRAFGNLTAMGERTRDADVASWLESVLGDVRYALRSLHKAPGFTAVALLSLGLGIGANTAIFSVVDAVLLRTLPVKDPQQLVQLTYDGDAGEFTNPLWEQIRSHGELFDGAFAYSPQSFNLAERGEARRVDGEWVSGDYFRTLGVHAALGRLFARGDDVRGCAPVAVVSADLAARELGGDAAVGRTLSVEGHPFTVIGVTEPGFNGVEVGTRSHVYVPICAEPIVSGHQSAIEGRSYWWLEIMARVRSDLPAPALDARLSAVSPGIFQATLPPKWPGDIKSEYLKRRLTTRGAATGLSDLRRSYKSALFALMGVVGLVLLVACVNVANLLLARATVRQREVATRMAIGAGRRRLVRQLLTESLLLAAGGTALGLVIAQLGSHALARLASTQRGTVWLDLSPDPRVLAFTTVVAVGTGLLFGLAPAVSATRVEPNAALKSGGRGGTAARGQLTATRSLVVVQLALSLMVLVAAGLLLGTFRNLVSLDPGFERQGVVVVSTDMQRARLDEPHLAIVRDEMLQRLRALPGVRAASTSMITPISGIGWNGGFEVPGVTPERPHDDAPDARLDQSRAARDRTITFYNGVSDGYFGVTGTPLLAGRDFDSRDRSGAPPVTIINETLARRAFGDANPVGRQIILHTAEGNEPPSEIVGVVRDAKYGSMREAMRPVAYLPIAQVREVGPSFGFQLRVDRAPAMTVPAIVQSITTVAPEATLDVTTLDEMVAGSLARERLLAVLAGVFGALALTLATIGLYGTMSYAVARRRNEIGIRIALGAERGRVLGLVLGDVGRLLVAGTVLGIVGALAATRVLGSLLFGVAPRDPVTFAAAALLLAAVGTAAGYLPAWRAAGVDPLATLREE